MLSFKGPIPLLLVAVVFSVALFFAYKDLSGLRSKLSELEKTVGLRVDAAIEDLSNRVKTQEKIPGDAYPDFGDEAADLRAFAEEAARVMNEEIAARQATAADIVEIKEEPVDVEPESEVAVSAPKKRSKKIEV